MIVGHQTPPLQDSFSETCIDFQQHLIFHNDTQLHIRPAFYTDMYVMLLFVTRPVVQGLPR
jgi:hypothetical protein